MPSEKDLSLARFTAIDAAGDLALYVDALEAFDAIAEIQELKALARERGGVAPGQRVLDVGCGFGLETLRLASLVAPAGAVSGIDKSAAFVAEAGRRAAQAGLEIDFRAGDAAELPFAEGTFDCVRAERLLIYLPDVAGVLEEMRRVLAPGGRLALIEPDFAAQNVNLPDRDLVRRVLAHEADTAVASSWLPGPLLGMLAEAGFAEIRVASRVPVFPQALGAQYFGDAGRRAAEAGAISPAELETWLAGLDTLRERGRLFATIPYFLFTARG